MTVTSARNPNNRSMVMKLVKPAVFMLVLVGFALAAVSAAYAGAADSQKTLDSIIKSITIGDKNKG